MATARKDLTDPQVQGPRRLLTASQVAERLGVPIEYVYRRLSYEGRLPKVKIGRMLRFDEADVEAFIDGGRVTPPDYAEGVRPKTRFEFKTKPRK